MVIDVDRCNGCGACMVACAVENNVPPARPEATDRTGITWLRVYRVNNGSPYPANRVGFVPVMCQHCGDTPCASVCPQEAVEQDPKTGIVDQMPQRCLGCRYCMAACPYHARYFNWWDPVWPPGMERTLNPAVAPRMRGVVEKCNLCHARLQAARAIATASGKPDASPAYVPACVEACPVKAIVFGDLNDPAGEAGRAARSASAFRLLERLGTDSKVYYRSEQPWIRQMAGSQLVTIQKEAKHA
jgi:molybdopterin-containing oxidoreductase family iron-sulfur binding subunit